MIRACAHVHNMNTNTSKDVIRRFFEALDYLRNTGVVGGVSVITTKLCIDRRNLMKVKYDPDRRTLQLGWLSGLVTEYNVSSEWLLTGEGEILNHGKG